MKESRLIVFDLDGTLVDSFPGIQVIGVATGSCPADDLRAAGCVDVISGVPALPRWLAKMPGT